MTDPDRLAKLEARLTFLEDKEKIREALSRYSYNIDLGRHEEYLAGWTDDAVLDLVAPMVFQDADGAQSTNGSGAGAALTGKAALRHMATDPNGLNKKYIENRALHTVCNLTVGVDGDTAWAECYSIVFMRTEDGMKPSTGGYNHWDLRRVGDDWLVVRRKRRDVGGSEWGGELLQSYLEQGPAIETSAN